MFLYYLSTGNMEIEASQHLDEARWLSRWEPIQECLGMSINELVLIFVLVTTRI